jgi:hypothetical protein
MDSKRVANQAVFRSVNDRISDLNESLADLLDGDPQFICECSDLACVAPISVAVENYRRIRENSRQFIVTPDHVEPDLADVVHANDGYVIVSIREHLAVRRLKRRG